MIVVIRRLAGIVLVSVGALAGVAAEAAPGDAALQVTGTRAAARPGGSAPGVDVVGADVRPGAEEARAAADEMEPRFGWPLSPRPAVVRPFQAPSGPYGPGHRGVDLAASPGQQVLAAGPGVVVFAGPVAGRPVISIDHDGGLRTTYEPVTPTVPVGTQVWRGQPIGVVEAGHPGCPVEACLHWGVRRGEEYLSPLPLVQTDSALRLKPW